MLVEGGGDSGILHTDREGKPSRLRLGNLVFFIIEREGRLAARVRDLAWREKKDFAGVENYPFQPEWRIPARWERLSQPLALEVPSATGELKAVTVSRRALFPVEGKEYTLLPLDEGTEETLFVFRDATSGKETYGGGRFLKARADGEGRLVLDFNRAFNPPCAFSPFATCPLPPPENWLSLAIRAGEKKYAGAY